MFYVFRSFELQGVIASYLSATFTRELQGVGDMEIKTIFLKENFEDFQINDIVMLGESDDFYLILEKEVYVQNGINYLTFKGKHLNHILSYRICSYKSTGAGIEVIKGLLDANFIAPSLTERKINNMVYASDLKSTQKVTLEYENTEVMTIIGDILNILNAGIKVEYDLVGKRYVVKIYVGEEKATIFSQNFNNVSEQTFLLSSLEEKNVALNKNGTFIQQGIKGIDRKETGENVEVKKVDALESILLENDSFKYLVDYDLGDTITVKMDIARVVYKKMITAIEVFYDEQGRHLTISV